MTTKTLDRRLSSILAGSGKPEDFILADAKDADMARGLPTPGPARPGPDGKARGSFVSRAGYLSDMEAIIRQGEVDILLCSASSGEALAERGLLEGPVSLAIRANDTTDIWVGRHAGYSREPSHPFRSANLELVRPFCDLGLYSITFNNDLTRDLATLEAFAAFREDARRNRFRYFLEVFNPNAPAGLTPEAVPDFVNDCIHRCLAGLTRAERPLFLKVAFNGARALEELVSNDPTLVVGLLGGSQGTTRDCYELLAQGARHGARVALFGRKIQFADSPLDLVALLRPVIAGALSPAEAVRSYHATLARKGIRPSRPFETDAMITDEALLDGAA